MLPLLSNHASKLSLRIIIAPIPGHQPTAYNIQHVSSAEGKAQKPIVDDKRLIITAFPRN